MLKKLSVLVPVVMLPLGLWLGYRAFGDYGFAEILASIRSIPSINLALALLFVAGSYLSLTFFDALAVRSIGKELPYPRVALASFVSLSIGHTVGFAVFSTGALRYRFYSGCGFSAVEVGRIILFCAVTVGLGLTSLAGFALVLNPEAASSLLHVPPSAALGIGMTCLALVSGYVLLAWKLRRAVCIRGHEFRLPNARLAAAQIAIGMANFAFVAGALHQLLAGAAAYSATVTAYVVGNATALLSHVPGGLGVLEYVVVTLIGQSDVIGALIAFRIVYFLLPLLLGSVLLGGAEVVRWRAR